MGRNLAFSLLVLLTVLCFAWTGLVYAVSGTGIVDANLQTFRDRLTEREGEAILKASQHFLIAIMVPLFLTNILWLLAFYFCRGDGENSREKT